jgi:adenosylcobinamide-GDP ribazoletransferase
MWRELCLLLMAVQRQTRLPAARWLGAPQRWPPEWQRDSRRHDAFVGLIVGGAGAAVLWMAAHAWPAPLSVLLSMAATLWLTSARAERGLAAASDAPAQAHGAWLGAAGAIALFGALALKAAALHGLATRDLDVALMALPLAHTWSRAAVVLVGRDAPDVAPAGAGMRTAATLLWAVCAAVCAAVAAGVFIAPATLVLAALATALCAVLCAMHEARRSTGRNAAADAMQVACELVTYLALLAMLARG